MSLAKWVLTGPVQVIAILFKIAGNLLRSDIESLLTHPISHVPDLLYREQIAGTGILTNHKS